METKLSYQMNVFAPTEEVKGRRVLPANTDSISGIVDASQADALLPGDPVKIVATTQGLPHFAKAGVGDVIAGFVEWNVIRPSYPAGKICQISMTGNVMYMEAAGAVEAGALVNITNWSTVVVGAAAGSGSKIGLALEAATAAGQLIRVKIGEPVAYAANT